MNRFCGERFVALARRGEVAETEAVSDEAQASRTVLMVRPSCFGFHPEAAASNAFAGISDDYDVRTEAIRETERLAAKLHDFGVEVLMLADSDEPEKPDAVFPNNWVSFHDDGAMVLYPMATQRRRMERNAEGLTSLLAQAGFAVPRLVDLSGHEQEGRFLEGTGSLILDRPRRRAFASRSIRTDPEVIAEFDRKLGYSTFLFDASDRDGQAIYHTNVLLSLGTEFAILCPDVVPEAQRARLIAALSDGRSLIEVDYDQLRHFACNLIELAGRDGPVISLSETALRSLRPDQQRTLEQFGSLAAADIPTIEQVGGGSVRCMIADIHLPRG